MKRWIGAVAAVLLLGAGCGLRVRRLWRRLVGHRATKTLTVYAAASLTSTFTELGKQFEADHEGVKVRFSFGGSSDLVAQIQQGAAADVFASADTANMDKATGDDLVEGDPVDFASNTLEIAVPPDNPAGVASLAGPREAGDQGRRVCTRGALRRGGPEGRGRLGGHDQAGQRGAVRHRRTQQGADR